MEFMDLEDNLIIDNYALCVFSMEGVGIMLVLISLEDIVMPAELKHAIFFEEVRKRTFFASGIDEALKELKKTEKQLTKDEKHDVVVICAIDGHFSAKRIEAKNKQETILN